MRFAVVLLSLCFASLSISNAQENDLISCFEKSYNKEFDFKSELLKLEKTLLDKGVLVSNNFRGYEELLNSYSDSIKANTFSGLRGERYVSKYKFDQCLYEFNSDKRDSTEIRFIVLFIAYHAIGRHLAKIQLQINDGNKLVLDGKEVELNDLTSALKIRSLKLSNVPLDEVIIEMKVYPETRMGFVVDVQEKIRDAGIRIVNYVGR